MLRSLKSGIGKSAIIYLAAVSQSIGMGTINLGLVFYLRDMFHATPTDVGLVAALFSVTYIIGCFGFRPLTRLLLPRFSLLVSGAINVLSVAGMLIFHSTVAVAVCNALYGFGVSLFWPQIMGWLSIGLEGRRLGTALGRFNMSWSLGLVVSPLFAGLLSEVNVRYPMFAGIVMLSSTALIVLFGSLFLPAVRNDRHREPDKRAGAGLGEDDSTPLRFPAWIGAIVAYLLVGIFRVVFPIHARTNLGLSESAIGAVLLLQPAANTIAFIVLARISIWHHRGAPIIVPSVLLALLCVALALFDHVATYLAMLPLIGACSAFAYTESMFHGVSGAVAREKRMAIHEALLVCGMVTGAFGGSYVFQVATAARVFLLTALVLITGAIGQIAMLAAIRRRRLAS